MNKKFLVKFIYLALATFVFVVFANNVYAASWPIDCASGYNYIVNAGESARCQTTYLDSGAHLDGGTPVFGTKASWTGMWYCDSMSDKDTYYCCKNCTQPINGRCGAANGVARATAPTKQLCAAGNPSAVSGTSSWAWSCYGLNGGTKASCSAPKICTYVSAVTQWSACTSGVQYATSVEYATSTGSCTDIPISRACTVTSTSTDNDGISGTGVAPGSTGVVTVAKIVVGTTTVTDESCNSLRISWDSAIGATSYLVFRGTNQDNLTQIAESSQLSIVDNGLTGGTTYYYGIKAKNSYGTSDMSQLTNKTLDGCISGACGTNGTVSGVTYYASAWPEGGTFCSVGVPSENPIVFPTTEKSWLCIGNTGVNPTCRAIKGTVSSGNCEITQVGGPMTSADTFYINKSVNLAKGNIEIPAVGGKTYSWYEEKSGATTNIGSGESISRLITAPVGSRKFILEVKSGGEIVARCEKTANFISSPSDVSEQ